MKKTCLTSVFLLSAIFISQSPAGDWSDETQSSYEDSPAIITSDSAIYTVKTASYQWADKNAKLFNTVLAVGFISQFAYVALLGAGTNMPILAVGGAVADVIALPVLGINASTMGKYMAERNPAFKNPTTGWYFYGASWALAVGGYFIFKSGNEEYNDRWDANGNENESAGSVKVVTGFTMQMCAIVSSGIALYLIERKISKSRNAFNGITLSPLLLRRNGSYAVGMGLQAPLSFNFAGN